MQPGGIRLLLSSLVVAALAIWLVAVSSTGSAADRPAGDIRTLDGSGNNRDHVDWGKAGRPYSRVAAASYGDGIGAVAQGPSARRISNRVFNDLGQNVFSENNISQWGWTWGQFIDHDVGLRDETPAEPAPIEFDAADPLEGFHNVGSTLGFDRTPAAAGTGTNRSNPRQQSNTLSSYIDASQVYGTTSSRLGWLRAANGYDLMLPNGYLPHPSAKPGAPPMDLMGQLAGNPSQAIVAGDVRANENVALTALQTLFAREHNRIADSLPATLSAEDRFQVARRVVGAEIQYVTYTQFLPALGVRLPDYRGYDPRADATLGNEFATAGFRAHSMVHGEFEPTVSATTFTAAQLAEFESQGIEVEHNADGTVTLVVPLGIAFGNPVLLERIGIGRILESLGEREYNNDETIDNAMRSVLFQVPNPAADPPACNEPAPDPSCFSVVADVGADDIQRGRDHGIPRYNALRVAYGLRPARTFTDITGERTDALPAGLTIDSPAILDFVSLSDANGKPVPVGNNEDAVSAVRRSSLAARLKAVYGSVDNVDAFVGMVSEPHVRGSELGALQQAIWKRQFTATRDGDRFFYAGDPELQRIRARFGVDFRHTLAEIVALDTDGHVARDVFHAP